MVPDCSRACRDAKTATGSGSGSGARPAMLAVSSDETRAT